MLCHNYLLPPMLSSTSSTFWDRERERGETLNINKVLFATHSHAYCLLLLTLVDTAMKS
jgi:hypothetical protein